MSQISSIMRSHRILGATALIASVFFVLHVIGYDFSSPGWKVGEKAFKEKNVKLCSRIVNISIFGPPTAMRRAQCIRTYAELTKDPSVCELLMPSSYGLSCVGGAQSEPDLCSMSSGEVRWKDGSETYASCADPTKKRTKDGDACCLIARIAFVKSENDCSSLESYSEMHDQCLQSLAFKNHNPAVCEGIGNENTKSACTVNAQAIRKNPSICDGCKARVNTLDQLQ